MTLTCTNQTRLRAVVLTVTLGGLALAAGAHADDWGYVGAHAPAFWAKTPGWEACAGTAPTARQSPIDLDKAVTDRQLQRLRVDVNEAPVALINNGHTIEEEYEPGSSLIVDGVRYDLAQFHFHAPSEHTVHGEHAAMEMHVVFAAPGSDKKVVIGLLYQVGRKNALLSELIASGVPQKSGEHVEAPSRHVNVADALTDTSQYYTYAGSLTTPPCSETVTWFVLKERAELSDDQLEAFRKVLGNNVRPLQKLNHRVAHVTPAATR